jgi:hypothetical protein
MKRIMMMAAVMIFAAACASAQPAIGPIFLGCPVRLNEVMVNPGSGTDDGEEFIELWNTSSTTDVDITGWTLTDGEDTDSIVDYTGSHDAGLSGLVIPANGFALIVEGDYDGDYDDFIEDYACPDSFIMVKVSDNEIGNILADGGDNITVNTTWPSPFIGGGYCSLSYTWGSATEGVSIERDRYDSSTWMDSPDPNGATPCVINSYN